MKKPKRKDKKCLEFNQEQIFGYNTAIDDMNAWLPSEEEIYELLKDYEGIPKGNECEFCKPLAKVISKRIRE